MKSKHEYLRNSAHLRHRKGGIVADVLRKPGAGDPADLARKRQRLSISCLFVPLSCIAAKPLSGLQAVDAERTPRLQ